MRKLMVVLSTLLLTIPLTGCWDRKEINELALVIAKGVDLTNDHKIRVCVQVAVPSKVGGAQTGSGKGEGGKSFFVVSGTGRTVSEADERVQAQLSRQLYLPHLRIILVGEAMAKSGMDQILDYFGRNPPHRLRTSILVARNGEALTFLNTTYPLESMSGEAVRKLERQLIGMNTTLMDFMIQSASEGTDQYTSAISLVPTENQGESSGQAEPSEYFSFLNQAVFRDLKLIGYLNTPESIALQWMNERLRYTTLTTKVPKANGTISVQLTQARRHARTVVRGNHVEVHYELSGSGMLTENGTGLDADDPETFKLFQGALNHYIEQNSQACLNTLFKKFDADPTGVGQIVYHQHPYDWERLKDRWHDELPKVKFVVTSEVKIIEGGKSGPPLYGKPQRGIKTRGTTSKRVGGGQQ